MGLDQTLVYLDSCLVIYIVEQDDDFSAGFEKYFEQTSNPILAVSDLTKMECLVMPIRQENIPLIDKFEGWFSRAKVLSLTVPVFEKATILRADFPSLKTPDALHIAAAIHYECDEFWTNDNRLNKIAPSIVKNIGRD